MVVLTAVPVRGQGIDLKRLQYSDVPKRGIRPEFAATIDTVAAALSLPPLRRVRLPTPYRELRLWYGFGLFEPHGFVRIVSHHGAVGGEMYLWGNRREGSAPEITGHDEWLRRYFGCIAESTSQDSEISLCRVRFETTSPWREALDTFENHNVWDLPDQADDIIGFDGWSLVVEALEGAKYRTYEYWVPDSSRGAAERDAEAILDYAWSLYSGATRAQRQSRVMEEADWCAKETSYARAIAEMILRHLRGKHLFQEAWLDPERWELVDERICGLLREAEDSRSDEYSTLAYSVEEGFLIFEIGKEGTLAEGCGEVEIRSEDLARFHGRTTLCFHGGDDQER